MKDPSRGGGPSDDELDIQIAPVDDEFAASPSLPPRRVEIGRERASRVAAPAPVAEPAAPGTVAPAGPAAERVSERSVPRLYFEAMVATLVLWLFGVTFLVQPVAVRSGSMLNTILVGEHLLVNRMAYGGPAWLAPPLPHREVRRGDVVVFKHPSEPENLYVKRVVALPGETIEIYGARVYVDGRELDENKALARDTAPEGAIETVGEPRLAEGARYTVYYSQLRDLGEAGDGGFGSLVSADRGTVGVGRPFKVPEGHYFCLGDNRDNSADSRYWGTVPRENVIGRAVVVYWSVDPASRESLPGRVRWSRLGTLIQ